MGCGCGKAKQVIAATRVRDALARGAPAVALDTAGCSDPAQHREVVERLVARVNARPGLHLVRRLACGCRVDVR